MKGYFVTNMDRKDNDDNLEDWEGTYSRLLDNI